MTAQTLFTANGKSVFQLPGLHSGIQGPKSSPEHFEQEAFKGKTHTLVSCSAAAGGGFLYKQVV